MHDLNAWNCANVYGDSERSQVLPRQAMAAELSFCVLKTIKMKGRSEKESFRKVV